MKGLLDLFKQLEESFGPAKAILGRDPSQAYQKARFVKGWVRVSKLPANSDQRENVLW